MTVTKTIKEGSKAAANIKREWERSNIVESIFDIYKNFSSIKFNAFNECLKEYCRADGVYGLRCCGRSSFAFSVVFRDVEGNYYKITKDNYYKVIAA